MTATLFVVLWCVVGFAMGVAARMIDTIWEDLPMIVFLVFWPIFAVEALLERAARAVSRLGRR